MKHIRTTIATFVASTLILTSASASVTIQIQSAGWGDATTTGVNGMTWGIVINSAGGAFDPGTLTALETALLGFDPNPIANPSAVQLIGATNLYFARAQLDTAQGGPGVGFANGFMELTRLDYSGPVGPTDAYGLLWLPAGDGPVAPGAAFGFQDLGQTLPGDGLTTPIIPSTPGLTNGTVIPEPSTLGLVGLVGLVAMIRRRRA